MTVFCFVPNSVFFIVSIESNEFAVVTVGDYNSFILNVLCVTHIITGLSSAQTEANLG